MSNETQDKDKVDSNQVLGTIPTVVFLQFQSRTDALITEMILSLRSAQYKDANQSKRIEELEATIERMKLERLK